MLSENVWLCAFIQIALFATLQAQAPGDGSSTCQNSPFIKTPFPSNIVPLMDSYDYIDLTAASGGPWSTLDVDGDTRTWAQAGYKACRQVMGSCSYSSGTQNNWLITQHINTTVNGKALSQVVVRVNFSLNGCPTGGSCQQSFLLQMYQTRNIDPSGSINPANYAAFSGSRVTVGSNPSGTIVDAQDVTVPLGASGGLYLAAQDTGTCVSITHLAVFYYVCPQQEVNFISYPMNASNGAITQLSCVSRAGPVGMQPPLATCSNQGVWGAPIGACYCNPGYTSIGQTCQSCPPGTYKSAQGNSVCFPCPSNSSSSINGSSQCPCLQGYYRPAGSGADSGCIAAPSVAVAAASSTPVIVGVVVAVVVMVGALLFILVLVGLLKHTSKSAMLQGSAVKLSIMDQPPQPVQPICVAVSGQEMTTLKSTQPVQSMQPTPNADTMYQPLSKEFTSSPSTIAEMNQAVSL